MDCISLKYKLVLGYAFPMGTFSTELRSESPERVNENEKMIKHEIESRKCMGCGAQMLLGYLRPMNANRVDDLETEVLWDGGGSLGILQSVDAWACPKCGNIEFKVIFPQEIKNKDDSIGLTQNEKSKQQVNSLTQPMIYEFSKDNIVKKYCPDCTQPIEIGDSKCPVCGKKIK
jgi:Zn finger protein HypA/HybF involved in hydrogenase expression